MTVTQKTIIGWKESVNLPDWGIHSILAKADTGARRSAIDVKRLHLLPDGQLEFDIVLNRKNREAAHTVRSPVAHVTHVRSSNGQQHERYFVETRIQIGNTTRKIELSLVCRKSMVCRMLLGRKALEGFFLVDPDEKYQASPRRKTRVRQNNSNHL